MNSVQKAIDGETIASQIRLARQSSSRSFLLVEGISDKRFFKRFTDESECFITVCFGKENALAAIKTLAADDTQGVLGVLDRDFSEIFGYPEHSGYAMFTDHNDLEIMILTTDALDIVLTQYADDNALQKFETEKGKTFREVMFDISAFLGALRIYSIQRGLNMKFEGMKYRFLDRNSVDLDRFKTVQHVTGRTDPKPRIPHKEIMDSVETELKNTAQSRDICCGHDCVRIFGRALNRQIGKVNIFDSDDGVGQLETILRVAYSWENFQKTKLYENIRDWEIKSGHKVLQRPQISAKSF